MDFQKLETSLNYLISQRPLLTTGINLIITELETNFNIFNNQLHSAIEESYTVFRDNMNWILKEAPASGSIIAFNLGIFETEEGMSFYIMGSNEWNVDDSDWACNDYFPENRYIELLIFEEISKIYRENQEAFFYLSIAVAAMYMMEYFRYNKDKFIKGPRKFIYLATGFDDGDVYNICKLTEDGLVLID